MLFLLHAILILFYLLLIVVSCCFFTNATEHLGKRLKLGSNAVGSILAVIGTTLPETIVPVVAILGSKIFLNNSQIGEQIALGGIIGSPFMLCCLAMFLVGMEIIILYLFKKRRILDLNIDHKLVLRDYKYFLSAYIPATALLFISGRTVKYIVVIYLICLYILYIYRTLIKSKQNFCEECIDKLIFAKLFNKDKFYIIIFQIIVSLILLVISINYFVVEIKYFSNLLNVYPVILSLIITPFATELPECINSLIWVKHSKDDLALFNIQGAIVFQAIIPMSIGILFTPFRYDPAFIWGVVLTIICSLIFVIGILLCKKVSAKMLFLNGLFYFAFILFLIFN